MNKEKTNIEKLKELAEDFYEYTTEISITETELFCDYEYLEDLIPVRFHRETTHEDYEKEITKDILYDLVFNKEAIEKQISYDAGDWSTDSAEYEYIKETYKKLKDN